MASYYWIKLYDEILDDPKMGRLSDGAFRLCINLFLMANRQEARDGSLPDVEDIAWTLRLSNETAQQYLAELERAGIVAINDGDLVVTNFEKRQAAITVNDRVKQYRERKRKEQFNEQETVTEQGGNESVTKSYTDKEEDIDIDKEQEEESSSSPSLRAVFKSVHNATGGMNIELSQMVEDAYGEYGGQWVLDAVKESVRNGVYKWNYIEAILRNWKQSGRQTMNGKSNGTVKQANDAAGGVYV